MAARTKMTPFARFIIMLLIVTPVAYFGASYYNGEDGLQNIKDFIGGDNTKVETVQTATLNSMSKSELISKIELLEMRIDQLEQKLENLESQTQ